MSIELMDLKVIALDRVYARVSRSTLAQWAMEGRIARGDLVRISGTEEWLGVAAVPWLAASMPAGVLDDTVAGEEGADLDADAAANWIVRRTKRRFEEAGMDMTPMIDVTFQLLIFFMLANSMVNQTPMEVPQAEFGRGVTPEGKQVILVDEMGAYYLGETTAKENLSPGLDALIDEVRGNLTAAGPREVIVTAHRRSKHQQVRQLVDRLGSVPNVGSILLGVEEKR
jgi:biopolymer transport protein ExbD